MRQHRPRLISPFSRSAGPVMSSTAGSPERNARAEAFTASSATRARSGAGGTGAGPEPSSHAVSPGRIKVATCPGGVIAAALGISFFLAVVVVERLVVRRAPEHLA